MRFLLRILSWCALGLLFLAPILYLFDIVSKPALFSLLLAGTIAWFATAPFVMGGDQAQGEGT